MMREKVLTACPWFLSDSGEEIRCMCSSEMGAIALLWRIRSIPLYSLSRNIVLALIGVTLAMCTSEEYFTFPDFLRSASRFDGCLRLASCETCMMSVPHW